MHWRVVQNSIYYESYSITFDNNFDEKYVQLNKDILSQELQDILRKFQRMRIHSAKKMYLQIEGLKAVDDIITVNLHGYTKEFEEFQQWMSENEIELPSFGRYDPSKKEAHQFFLPSRQV